MWTAAPLPLRTEQSRKRIWLNVVKFGINTVCFLFLFLPPSQFCCPLSGCNISRMFWGCFSPGALPLKEGIDCRALEASTSCVTGFLLWRKKLIKCTCFAFVQTCLRLKLCLLNMFSFSPPPPPFFFVFSIPPMFIFWWTAKGWTVHKCMYTFTYIIYPFPHFSSFTEKNSSLFM